MITLLTHKSIYPFQLRSERWFWINWSNSMMSRCATYHFRHVSFAIRYTTLAHCSIRSQWFLRICYAICTIIGHWLVGVSLPELCTHCIVPDMSHETNYCYRMTDHTSMSTMYASKSLAKLLNAISNWFRVCRFYEHVWHWHSIKHYPWNWFGEFLMKCFSREWKRKSRNVWQMYASRINQFHSIELFIIAVIQFSATLYRHIDEQFDAIESSRLFQLSGSEYTVATAELYWSSNEFQ